jgi:23S rRNA (cytosine1962-C5)-methyltransferase
MNLPTSAMTLPQPFPDSEGRLFRMTLKFGTTSDYEPENKLTEMGYKRIADLCLLKSKHILMTNYTKIILKHGKEAAVRRFHPWLFSGAIHRINGQVSDGDIVELFSGTDEYLATGHYQEGSIAVKIFSFVQSEINIDFWREKLFKAFELRSKLGLTGGTFTNAYRLVYGEGDGLPGLIIDYYNGVCVLASSSSGIDRIKPELAGILKEIYGEKLTAVYDKSIDSARHASRVTRNEFLYGNAGRIEIIETGHRFMVDIEKGQKTGFFLDQRSNRMFAQFYGKDKKVMNAFCYSGAFSVYALKGGAGMVHSIDSSRQAIEWTAENIALNGIDPDKHRSVTGDIRKYLEETDETYDMIILDPPAFAKTHTVSHNALQAYRYVNAQAMKKLNKNGILFTFSCSQAISREMFVSAVMAAALETGREVKILHHLSQGPDHPVSIYHPEGEYLKGLILFVE